MACLSKLQLAALAVYIVRRRRRRNRKRKWWIHPIIVDRHSKGKFVLLHIKLRDYPDKFFDYYRMSIPSFDLLLSNIEVMLQKNNTKLRDCIGAEQKLAVTLRYLGTGCSMKSLHYEFLLGRATISSIIVDTCTSIWKCLQPEYMPVLTKDDFKEIALNFEKTTNFPNCIGAIDGKHVRLVKPWNSASEFFCHKQFFSMVLMAVADSDYCFRYIDVGGYGHECDSNILKGTKFGRALYNGSLPFPDDKPLSSEPKSANVPFVFIGDEGFALNKHVMRPFPRKSLTFPRKVFNYRLSRARRIVECSFGILANKWRIFHRAIDVNVNLAETIIKTCCILHNYVRRRDGYRFEDTLTCPLDSIENMGLRGSNRASDIRDIFCNYTSVLKKVQYLGKMHTLSEKKTNIC